MWKYKTIYSVTNNKDDKGNKSLSYGTVETQVLDSNHRPDVTMFIKDRQDGEVCISDIGSIRNLHTVLENVLKDVDNRMIEFNPKWKKV